MRIAHPIDRKPATQASTASHPTLEVFASLSIGTQSAQDHPSRVHLGRIDARLAGQIAPAFDQCDMELALDRLEQLERLVCSTRRCEAFQQADATTGGAAILQHRFDEIFIASLQDQRCGCRCVFRRNVAGGANDDVVMFHDALTRCCPPRACN